jgi:hypothetical protein
VAPGSYVKAINIFFLHGFLASFLENLRFAGVFILFHFIQAPVERHLPLLLVTSRMELDSASRLESHL